MRYTRTRNRIFHVLTIIFIVVSLCFSVFRFSAVFGRVIEAVKDCATSIAYYFLFMFEKEYLVTASIGTFPENLETILPLTLDEFEKLMSLWFSIVSDWTFVEIYLEKVGDVVYQVSQTLTMLLLPTFALVFLVVIIYGSKDTAHNVDSKSLIFWRRIYRRTIRPAKFYARKYLRFLKRKKWYVRALVGIWLYNLSGATIAIETVAWYFYFAVSFDFEATLVWIAKVLADFTVPLFFFPPLVWVIIGYKVFDYFRIKIGVAGIKGGIEKNVKFLKEYLGAKFLNGKQRSKKTSLLTQWKTLSESKILRPQAKQGFLNRTKQFQNFPWIIYARYIIEARKKHVIYNWTRFHTLFLFLKWASLNEKKHTEEQKRWIRRHLRRHWNYNFDNYVFGYKTESEIFDDGLELVGLYDALENYGKQFYLYSHPTPIDMSNYPIRADFELKDEGNLPEFKNNLVEMNTYASHRRTQWSHRINNDAFRLGEQFDPYNAENNSFEFGIKAVMERDKERKNQLTRRQTVAGENEPTQNNDLEEVDTKIRTHIATCDNFTYQEDLSDAQRAGSLGVDNTDLMTKIYIRSSKNIRFYVPFFAIDEAIYLLASAIFDTIYLYLRKKKGSNTALERFLWLIYTPIYRHYIRYKNIFSYYPLELKIEDGADNEILAADKKLPLISLVAYRGRFRTDALGAFYYRKIKSATMGLNDVPMYKDRSMTMDEMIAQNSYMVKDFMRAFSGSWNKKNKKITEKAK